MKTVENGQRQKGLKMKRISLKDVKSDTIKGLASYSILIAGVTFSLSIFMSDDRMIEIVMIVFVIWLGITFFPLSMWHLHQMSKEIAVKEARLKELKGNDEFVDWISKTFDEKNKTFTQEERLNECISVLYGANVSKCIKDFEDHKEKR